MTTTLRRLATVATGQLGSFSRAQAHDEGISDHQLRRRVQSGFLVQIGPNAFRLAGPTGLLAELHGLARDVGAPCWVSGPTAAAVHGFDGFRLQRPFHLTIPRERNVRRLHVVVHSSGDLPGLDRESVEDLPVTSPTRTLVDLAGATTAEALTAALDGALRDGLTSEDLLHRRIAALRTRGRYGIPALLDVLDGREATRGGHSWLEREFLRLVAGSALPRPECQVVLSRAGDRIVRVDCRFPGTPVVVELLGYRHHRTTQQMSRDAERLNALVLDGFTPFQFTYDQVVSQPAVVTATVDLALRRASA